MTTTHPFEQRGAAHDDSGGRPTSQSHGLTVEWFKQRTGYYQQPDMLAAGERAEVLYMRAKSYCADTETSGFIPDSVLPMLTPVGWKARAAALIAVGLWRRAQGGYMICDWDEDQAELEAYAARKRADRERKRAQRERDRHAAVDDGSRDESDDLSRDRSRDSHVNVRTQEKEKERDPSSSLSPHDLIRAARVVNEEEEDQFLAWIRTAHQPKSGAWWRTVAANGDFADLADQWRTMLLSPSIRGARCPVHRLEFPCRSCAADTKVAPDEDWPPRVPDDDPYDIADAVP